MAEALLVVSTVMSVVGSIAEGKAAAAEGKAQQGYYDQIAKAQEAQGVEAQNQAEFVAKQNESIAGQERATSQRKAQDDQRKKRYAESRAQAVSASSGAGALDPTVQDIMGGLEDEGNYNALVSLYEGESSARNYESQAQLNRYEGAAAKRGADVSAYSSKMQGALAMQKAKNAQAAANMKAVTSLVSGGSTLYGKYGGGGASGGYKTAGAEPYGPYRTSGYG